MAFVHGKTSAFGIGVVGATASSVTLTSYENKVDWPRVAETADTTTFGKNDRTHIPGLKSGSVAVEGLWDAALDAIYDPKVGTIISIFYAPAGSGTAGYYADAILTEYNPPSEVGAAVKFTAKFLVTGPVTRATLTIA